MKEALFYEKIGDKKVRCFLCARSCRIDNGGFGFCAVRKNIDGALYSMVYGKPCSIAIDPIEKKPLYHFLPGTRALSIATVGCNFRCSFCQNFEISQAREMPSTANFSGKETSPKEIIDMAKKAKVESIAYTYTEPTMFYEYALDIMKLAKKAGLKNVWVSNGYITKDPIRKMSPYLDAINVDLKGDEKVYRELCGASLKPVLESLREFKKQKVWIEITCLIIPEKNDSEKWMNEISLWIKENLGEETPLHLSRFFPMHRLTDIRPTPLATLKKLHAAAKKNLLHVYLGNVPPGKEHSTFCQGCGTECIGREGYGTETKIRDGRCGKCGEKVAGVFENEKKSLNKLK